jgi:hypothetical protein
MRWLPFRRKVISYLIHLFSMPRVREEIAKYARAFTGEANRYQAGIKGEAIGTKESFIILSRYIKKEKITREERKKFKRQVFGLLKGIGVMVPPMLIPLPFVGTILLVVMDHLLLSMNIHLLPPSFYPENKEGLMTTKGVDKDLIMRK